MIFDLHNDFLTYETDDMRRCKRLCEYASSDDVSAVILAVWTTRLKEPRTLVPAIINRANEILGKNEKIFFALEDMHFVDLSNIGGLFLEKVLYCGLTWNDANSLAGGANSSQGLSALGKDIISIVEEKGVFVDTAHLNERSFWDVLGAAKNIVINSHCCFSSVHKHPRNINDDQIYALVERGGIIGLTLVSKFLSPHLSQIVDIFRHVDYFVSRFGCKNLAIGTDFFGTDDLPIGLSRYRDFLQLAEIMKNHGYSAECISDIFYNNARTFFKRSAFNGR